MKTTVLMSVYGGWQYLPKAIDSIIFQTHRDFEFVIVDDASDDKVRDLLIDYSKSDPRIKLVRNESNIGLTKSLNKGLRLASGDVIARMDADDIAHPLRLEQQLAHMKRFPNCGILATQGTMISGVDSPIKDIRIHIREVSLREHIMRHGNPFIHSSLMLRSALLDELGGYDEELPSRQDLDLLLKALNTDWDVSYLEQPLLKYRLHENSISSKPEVYATNLLVRLKNKLIEHQQHVSYSALQKFVDEHPLTDAFIRHSETRQALKMCRSFIRSGQPLKLLKTLPGLLGGICQWKQLQTAETVNALADDWMHRHPCRPANQQQKRRAE